MSIYLCKKIYYSNFKEIEIFNKIWNLKKIETYYLGSGRGGVIIENSNGEMETIEFENNKGYTTHIGQKHRIFSITNCDILEFSTPELGTTYRLEDDYNRSDETEEVRKQDNRGWNK